MATKWGITSLGHTGVWVHDLEAMRAFYTDVLGLTVTDEDLDRGIVFLSSRPDVEHHEMVLQRGAEDGPGNRVNQISWRLDSIEALRAFDERFAEQGVSIQQKVTHGNALSIYFFDPEGNRLEVYWATGDDVHQPFLQPIDVAGPTPEEVLSESRRLVQQVERTRGG
jgi:catechol-2,3-dioxygenase